MCSLSSALVNYAIPAVRTRPGRVNAHGMWERPYSTRVWLGLWLGHSKVYGYTVAAHGEVIDGQEKEAGGERRRTSQIESAKGEVPRQGES
jgi:hypothetical protein